MLSYALVTTAVSVIVLSLLTQFQRGMELAIQTTLKRVEGEYTPPSSDQLAMLEVVIDSSPNLQPYLQHNYRPPTEVCGMPPASGFFAIPEQQSYMRCLMEFRKMDAERKKMDVLSRIKNFNVCHMLGLEIIGNEMLPVSKEAFLRKLDEINSDCHDFQEKIQMLQDSSTP